jgi:hypothetical protein
MKCQEQISNKKLVSNKTQTMVSVVTPSKKPKRENLIKKRNTTH